MVIAFDRLRTFGSALLLLLCFGGASACKQLAGLETDNLHPREEQARPGSDAGAPSAGAGSGAEVGGGSGTDAGGGSGTDAAGRSGADAAGGSSFGGSTSSASLEQSAGHSGGGANNDSGGAGGASAGSEPAAKDLALRVGVSVTGLKGGELTLELNGGSQLVVSSDGRFVFDEALDDGASYVVAVTQQPDLLLCELKQSKGRISRTAVRADAAAVLSVTCVNNDPSLTTLSLSAGSLDPAFTPGRTSYAVTVAMPTLALVVQLTPADRDAAVTVNDQIINDGASAPIPLRVGPNQVTINVTARAGARRTYALLVSRAPAFLEQTYVKANAPSAGSVFGHSLSLWEDTLVVGAPLESEGGAGVDPRVSAPRQESSGAVYVFARGPGTFEQQAYIKAPVPQRNGGFGFSVALYGDTLAVGALGASSFDVGAGVYIYRRAAGKWEKEAYLRPSRPTAVAFGTSLSVYGDTLVIGDPSDTCDGVGIDAECFDDQLYDSGAAYVFVRDGGVWTEQAYLKASNGNNGGAQFGGSVSIYGESIAVGASREASAATGINGDETNIDLAFAGAGYIFVRASGRWTQQAYLKASSTESGDQLGSAVSLFDNTLVMSAPGKSGQRIASGGVYSFSREGSIWRERQYLQASNPGFNDLFGMSVSLFNNILLVGAVSESSRSTLVNGDELNDNAPSSGAAYLFLQDSAGWKQQAYIKAVNTGGGDNFGQSVAAFGNTIAIGASFEDSITKGINGDPYNEAATNSGAVYVHSF